VRLVVNGEGRTVPDGTTVEVLARRFWRPPHGPAGMAVARNGEVVARSAWSATVLHEGDRVEVLGAMQGG
jgi:sulfur carrier protein